MIVKKIKKKCKTEIKIHGVGGKSQSWIKLLINTKASPMFCHWPATMERENDNTV